MDTLLDASGSLTLSMEQVLELMKALMVSAQKKEELIVADDVEGLSDLLAEEMETVSAVKQKEKELEHRADCLRRAAGIRNKTANLKEICSSIGDPVCRERLAETANALTEAVKGLGRRNDKLKELLHQRIGYADYMLNLLHSPRDGFDSYDMLGNKEACLGGFNFLDCHA